MRYNRILLKLSGESLMGKASYGIDPERLNDYSEEIAAASRENVQIAIVIGGGNIFRGMQGSARGFDRQTGDYMGMLATVINSLVLRSSLEEKGVKVKLMSGIYIEGLTEKANGMTAKQYLEDGYVVIFSGGTGNPFFTTDTASALRAVEISADAMFKGTRVDGVYTDDPEKNPEAIKYDHLTFHEAFVKELKIMDLTAFTMCEENKLPVIVFNMNIKGNLIKLLNGEKIGTRIE
ncbi:MAG TPA: UMP kinase [Bacteroidales bacterium]|nr:UMP kinase [Bacteroidales bacterium]HPI84987.1 UMP kinase [Bacteroidales bacterium]HPM91746.1 UMP kinase [Bacteroidales bacterium]